MNEDGFPRNPIAKHGFNGSTGNPFDNAVVTVDEVRRRETMPAGFPRSKLPGGGRGEAALGGRHVYAVVCGKDREKDACQTCTSIIHMFLLRR